MLTTEKRITELQKRLHNLDWQIRNAQRAPAHMLDADTMEGLQAKRDAIVAELTVEKTRLREERAERENCERCGGTGFVSAFQVCPEHP